MSGIILTDIYSMRKQYILCGCVGLGYIAIGLFNHTAWSMAIFLALFATILPVNSFTYNDQCQWDVYANTLPVQRRDMVNAKFAMILLLSLAAFLCSAIAIGVDNVIHGDSFSNMLLVPFIAGSCGLMYAGLFVTLIIKFGMERARVFLVAAFLIPGFFVMALSKMGFDLESLWLTVNKGILFIGFMAAAIVVLLISYILCRIFYKAKEL